MSETVQLALITALPPTIAALAALWVSLLNARRVAVSAVKTDTLIKKTDEIHELANNNLSKQTDALAVANEKIQALGTNVGQLVSVLQRPHPPTGHNAAGDVP